VDLSQLHPTLNNVAKNARLNPVAEYLATGFFIAWMAPRKRKKWLERGE
jgi:hypothetical protein